ncbi:cyclic nucleotide-binding domain-containing protein [Desulforhopalus sp. IMCC35007]|uniref:cyclic nucleotide-binding domain-containing protein n=1 Tax=Desulforhopalus sp. IMCC35007 TaxID=2569543 RepID=UPI0010AE0A81|nr:cyclic nucleotide-binding domain-containing protein [Desulforhopalus sp. IMCC35007]TKB07144.1 cyclic nucleotide-binding domain-containing protein [Desulforhopalus sp. IMCC35007]
MVRSIVDQDISGAENTEKKVIILLSDMVGYSQKTADMRPVEVRDFIVAYHKNLQEIINADSKIFQEIEPSAGDGALAVFEKQKREGKTELCDRAIRAAVNISIAVENQIIPQTRIGLFAGDIIEAQIGKRTMQFGSCFSVASRLEELCGYFGVSFLMDREVALWQKEEKEYLVSIGKITPKNITHPIHVFSIYKPGINQCPKDVDRELLSQFIEEKNRAVELFCGNRLQGIQPDYPTAREKLNKSQDLFIRMTGKKDVPTERLLEYIRQFSYPSEDFQAVGMKIRQTTSESLGIHLLHLSNELLKAMDVDCYQTLVVNTEWESLFKLVWKKKNEVIVKRNDPPDGIYYIDSGSVNALDREGNLITTLTAGNVFGEMAYFSDRRRRNATIIANTDVVLRRISGEEFEKLPVIKQIFQRIYSKRKKDSDV